MGLTEEQWAARRSFLGGTDLAALAGLSPYAGPVDVWRDKTEEEPARPASTVMALGTVLEPVVAALFCAATGMRARRREAPVRDKHRPWLGGHLDRLVSLPPGAVPPAYMPAGILECKWSMGRAGWGADYGLALWDGDNWRPPEVPAHYAVQVQHYLGVTGYPVGYLAVLLGYADFRWYAVPRDDVTIAMLRDIGRDFWHDNVLAGIAPEPDGSESYGRHLASKYRQDAGDEAVATPAQQMYAEALRQAIAARKAAESAEAASRQRLQESMKETARLILPNGSITWRSHDVKEVKWQSVARSLVGTLLPDAPADVIDRRLESAAEQFTTTSTRRPFRPEFDEEASNGEE